MPWTESRSGRAGIFDRFGNAEYLFRIGCKLLHPEFAELLWKSVISLTKVFVYAAIERFSCHLLKAAKFPLAFCAQQPLLKDPPVARRNVPLVVSRHWYGGQCAVSRLFATVGLFDLVSNESLEKLGYYVRVPQGADRTAQPACLTRLAVGA